MYRVDMLVPIGRAWKHLVTSFPCAGVWTFALDLLYMTRHITHWWTSHPSTVHSNRSGLSVCCVFTWDVTSPEFRTSSRIRMCTLIRFQLQVHRVDVLLEFGFMQKLRRIARNHKVAIFMNPVNVIFQMCRHLERFDTVVVRTDPRSDVKVHFHVYNLTTFDVLNLQSGNTIVDLYQWESPYLRAWCRRQFCLNKVDFRHLDYIYTRSTLR
jgi:hypothetical protein